MKNAVSIPVIGNGDVVSPETAKALYETTGCDLIMIGRGALGAPWLFRQVQQYLQTGAYEPTPPLGKRMELMVEQMTLAVQYKGERVASHEALWMVHQWGAGGGPAAPPCRGITDAGRHKAAGGGCGEGRRRITGNGILS